MSKVARQEKAHHDKGRTTVERNTIIDDNLLPPAEELSKLKEVDPNIVSWIKDRVEAEQNARIKFNDDRIELARKEINITAAQNLLSLVFAFLIIIGGFVFSAYLISQKLNLEGTLFGGSVIVIAATMFLKHGKNNQNKK